MRQNKRLKSRVNPSLTCRERSEIKPSICVYGGHFVTDTTVSCGSEIKSRVVLHCSTYLAHEISVIVFHQNICSIIINGYQWLIFPVVRGQTLGPCQGEGEGHHRGGQQEEPGQAESRHHQQWTLQGQGGEAGQRSLRAAAAAQQQAPGPH